VYILSSEAEFIRFLPNTLSNLIIKKSLKLLYLRLQKVRPTAPKSQGIPVMFRAVEISVRQNDQ